MHLSKVLSRIFLSFSLTLLLFLSPLPALAMTSGGTLVATVNIDQASITSQQDHTINGVFTISNGDGVQSGVRYGVELVSGTGKSAVIGDEKIFDDNLTLSEHTSLRKSFSYTAPASLSGSYQLVLTSKNVSGFPFAFYILGPVTLSHASQGLEIAPQSCVVRIDKATKTIPVTQTIVLSSPSQVVTLSCVVTNMSKSSVSAVRTLETRLRSAYGEVTPTTKIDQSIVLFKPSEKKTVSFIIPLATKPQTYSATIGLSAEGTNSNTVSLAYVIQGATATISNLSLDKDFYKRGDTASLSLVWMATTKVSAETKITNSLGLNCAKPIDQTLSPSNIEVLIPISTTCRDPHVSVSLKDDKGTVLDQKELSVKTISTSAGKEDNMLFTVLIVLAALAIAGIYIKKHKKTPSTASAIPMSAFLPIIIMAGVMSLFATTKASADTYTSTGPDGTACITSTVNVVPTTYAPNAHIKVTWKITNNCSSAVSVQLQAINNINAVPPATNPSATLMSPVTLSANGGSTGVFPLEDNLTFTAPSPSGVYKIQFQTGVDLPSTTPILVRVRNEVVHSPDVNSCTAYNGLPGTYLDGPVSLSYSADFYASMNDYINNIPLDVTGRNLKLKMHYYSYSDPYAGAGSGVPDTTAYSSTLSGTTSRIYGTPTTGLITEYYQRGQYVPSDCEYTWYGGLGDLTVLDGTNETVPYAVIPDYAPTVALSAPAGDYTGNNVTISWSVSGADSCTASNLTLGTSSGTFSGSQSYSVNGNSTFSLSCTNLVGTTSRTVTVQDYGPAPTSETCFAYPGATITCPSPNYCAADPDHPGYQVCHI